jgi:hypothetical protein
MKRSLILIVFLFSIFSVVADSEFIGFIDIPNLDLLTGENLAVIDLDDYYNGTDLFYKFKAGVDTLEGVEIIIGDEGEVDIIVDFPGERSVVFIADNDTDDKESNDVALFIEGDVVFEEIVQNVTLDFFPVGENVVMVAGEKKNFAVGGENITAEWYLNGLKLPETKGTFIFDAVLVGENELTVTIGEETMVWTVTVNEKEIVEEIEVEVKKIAQCGNSIKEKGENCGNCPSDVQCTAGSECTNDVCVKKKGSGMLGLILWIGGLGIVIVGLVVGIVFAKKKGFLDNLSFGLITKLFKKKIKEEKKESIEEEKIVKEKIEKPQEDLSSLKSYFLDNLKKGFKKEDLIKQTLEQGWSQEQVNKVLETRKELIPLKNYLIESLKKGFKKEDLIKQTLQQGWKQEDINEVLSKI